MPEPLPRPDGSSLGAEKKAVLTQILIAVRDYKFNWDAISAHQDEFVHLMDATCKSDEDIRIWFSEIHLWVRWFNGYGYYLAFFLTALARLRTSRQLGRCLDLQADAQCVVAEDVALHSMEAAYHFLLQNRELFGDSFAEHERYHKRRLQVIHDYFYRYAKPFAYIGSLPFTDHLYAEVTARFFGLQFPEIENSLRNGKPDGLAGVIEQCSTPELVYYRVLAHRHLGIAYSKNQDFKAGADQFLQALKLADEIHLDTEMGHLQRLYGYNLRLVGSLPDSEEQFRQCCAREMETDASTYWTALSFRGMADSIAERPAVSENPKERDLLIYSCSNGRKAFDLHVGMCPIPIARDSKQQLMRSFSEKAIRYTGALKRGEDVLGEIEASGPREATDVALEISAARRVAPEKLAIYRRNRARYYQALSTVSSDFDAYLEDFEVRFNARADYLFARRFLSPEFTIDSLTDRTVNAVLNLKLSGLYLLLFHVGEFESTAALVDITGRHIDIQTLAFTTSTICAIHKEYIAAAGTEGTSAAAVSKLLASYEALLGDYFRAIKPLVKGKHLKIFPRLEMNALPFHALRIDGEYLIETCDISYGQTLGLFLETTSAAVEGNLRDLMIVSGEGLQSYDGALRHVATVYAERASQHESPTWPALLAAFKSEKPRDIIFSCHGVFDRKSADKSYLFFSDNQAISFEDFFADLDLRGSRSILMGACESGVSRAEISAEYIGLAGAMLASGVPYVVGALWQVNELSTAILVERYAELLKDGALSVPAALCAAQRELLSMSREDLSKWIGERLGPIIPDLAPLLQQQIASGPSRPFADPVYWAGLQVTGAA